MHTITAADNISADAFLTQLLFMFSSPSHIARPYLPTQCLSRETALEITACNALPDGCRNVSTPEIKEK